MRGAPCTWPRRGELGQEKMGPGLPARLQRTPTGPLASSSTPSSGLGRCGDQGTMPFPEDTQAEGRSPPQTPGPHSVQH